MSFNHVVVWVDHTQAHVIHFNADAAETDVIKLQSSHTHLHTKAGSIGSGRVPEDKHYFEEVSEALKESMEILLVGPGSEKHELKKYLEKHHRQIAENVLGVETVDHPSDGQLLQVARKFFHKADLMR
jgi:stalled ribosome rescue protein Dom34